MVVAAMMWAGAMTVGPVAKAAEGPTDAQIVGIVLVADDLDIAYGKIALERSKNKAVR